MELNNEFRDDILSVPVGNLPLNWSEFDLNGLENVKKRINSRVPNYLNCEVKLCLLEDNCLLNKNFDKEIYVKSIIIVANLETEGGLHS